MKNLVILGSGNIGKIIYEYALLSKDYKTEWEIKGLLEFEDREIKIDEAYPIVIGSIENYTPTEDDIFICSYAAVGDRRKSVEIIESKGGKFINIIHPTANIATTNNMGVGNFIGAFTTLSVNTTIGNHSIIQDHCNVGHDCVIGDYTHLYVGNIVCGINNIGNEVTLYTGSTVYPKIKIESVSTVGAGSVVMRKVKEGTTVIGNPAKKME